MRQTQTVSRRSRRQLARYARQLNAYTAPGATVDGPALVSWWLALGGLFRRLGILSAPPSRPPQRARPVDIDIVPCFGVRASTDHAGPIRDVVIPILDARRR